MAYGKHPMHYGIMGEPGEGWPLRPGYQVLRLFTHTIHPGWRALKLDGDLTNNVAVAVAQGPKGELTVMAVNHTGAAQTVSIVGLPIGVEFRQILWSAPEAGRLADGAQVRSDDTGGLELNLPARSVAATTEGSGELKRLELEMK
jgi:hypothetical protein